MSRALGQACEHVAQRFRPQWRGQPFGTFRVLFNAAIFHGPVAAAAAKANTTDGDR